jgi:hypothetical protein
MGSGFRILGSGFKGSGFRVKRFWILGFWGFKKRFPSFNLEPGTLNLESQIVLILPP